MAEDEKVIIQSFLVRLTQILPNQHCFNILIVVYISADGELTAKFGELNPRGESQPPIVIGASVCRFATI